MIYGNSYQSGRYYDSSVIYNEADLSIPADLDTIPSEFTTFSELALFVAEGTEKDYNDMMQEIGVNELAVFESTGQFIVYEGAEGDGLVAKAVNLFKKIWEKIKGAFTRILNWFDERKRQKDVQFIAKVKAKMSTALANIAKSDPSRKFGAIHELKKEISVKPYVDRAHSMMENVEKSMLDGVNKDSDIGALKDEKMESVVKTVTGYNGTTFGDIKQDFVNDLIDENETDITAGNIGSYYDKFCKTVLDQVSARRAIKEAYNSEKKLIDAAITKAKKQRKSARKDKADFMVKAYAAQITVFKEIILCLHSCSSICLDVLKRNYNESKMILIKVSNATVTKNSSNTTANDESYYYDDNRSVIETAFDW